MYIQRSTKVIGIESRIERTIQLVAANRTVEGFLSRVWRLELVLSSFIRHFSHAAAKLESYGQEILRMTASSCTLL